MRGNKWCSTWWLKLKCMRSTTANVVTLIEFSIGSLVSVWGRMKWLVAMYYMTVALAMVLAAPETSSVEAASSLS